MAGRRAVRPQSVAVLGLSSVDDPATQRAFDATQDAVTVVQTQLRRARKDLDALPPIVSSMISAEDFGAVGDGVTDDTQAIQLALDAAEGEEAVVYVPSGVHAISDTLYVPNKVVLTGVGRGDAGKLRASAAFPNDGRPMIRLGRSADTLVFGSRVENMILDANSRAGTCVYTTCAQEQSGCRFVVATGFTQYGIHYTNDTVNFTSGAFIEDTEVLPQAAGATTGIFLNGVALCTNISRVTAGVSGPLTNALHVTRAQCLVNAFHLENCTNGINLDVFSATVLIGINPTNTLANVTNVILDSSAGATSHVGIGLVKNAATNLINYGSGTVNTDASLPLWVMGNTIEQGARFATFEAVPAQITANQNDYNPALTSNAQMIHVSSDAARDITGWVLATGRVLKVRNRGAFTITLKHQNGGSAAANRFNGRGNADVALLAGTTVELYKSAVDSCVEVMNSP